MPHVIMFDELRTGVIKMYQYAIMAQRNRHFVFGELDAWVHNLDGSIKTFETEREAIEACDRMNAEKVSPNITYSVRVVYNGVVTY